MEKEGIKGSPEIRVIVVDSFGHVDGDEPDVVEDIDDLKRLSYERRM